MLGLAGMPFCVFGLGDSTYSQFCVAAAGFDTGFKVLWAPALPLGQGIPAPSYRVNASSGGLAKPEDKVLEFGRMSTSTHPCVYMRSLYAAALRR